MGSRLENNSNLVQKRIAQHTFDDEDGEEYQGSTFGDFPAYFRRKKLKLLNRDVDLRSQAGDRPQIFNGVVAHVNGYTQPSLNDLHTIIVQHGGGFMQYLDGKTTVTHIIASSLTPKKFVDFQKYRIVKPAWVVDSLQAGKLLPWNDYRVVDEGEKQKVLAFDQGRVMTQAKGKARGYKEQTDNSWYNGRLGASQAPASTPTPSSTMHSRFPRQKLPSPDDEIEDAPPSHQPEKLSFEEHGIQRPLEGKRRSEELVTPSKTSPTLGPQKHDHVDQIDELATEKGPKVQSKPLTAEEHNSILLRDPKIRRSTVVDPNFLEQYYRESRLHHLSTWKADLKSQMQALANETSAPQKIKQRRPPGARRYILHIDFDSFFAAVSLKKHPQYIDKPAVVAHGNSSGSEIASCNYPARTFGIKNGMWMKKAQELCPDVKILPYDFPAYEEASRAFYDVIIATGGIVQSVSIDEALVDISNMCAASGGSDGLQAANGSIVREQAKAEEIALALRDQVKLKTGCNVSVGVGGNILLAKVALRKAKPAEQYQIKPEEVLDFIGQLQVQDLPGVAWSNGAKLEEIGIKYVRDIRETTKEKLVQTLGPKTGEKLWEYSRGIDRQEVGEQVVRKSVSAEVNWGVRFENQEQADEFVGSLCGELQKRLLKEKVKGKQFTMKIMRRSPDAPLDPPKHLGHGKCDTYNKSLVLGVATNSKEVLTKEALSILKGFGFSPGELRGIGIQMTKLEPMKSATDGSLEGSQRRLQFKIGNTEPKSARKPVESVEADPIQDDPITPRKPKEAAETDERVSFGPAELNHSTPSRRPLNMMGTQFIIPTQVDPKVLAELPEDIRSKLLRQARQSSPTPASRKAPKPKQDNEPLRPQDVPFALTALPAHSQLDPEILAALPPDVRAEVLAQYSAGGAPPHSPSDRANYIDQAILPQSPRKNRIIGIPIKRPTTAPVKRGRGRPPKSAQLAAAALASAKDKTGRTLMQASFITLKNPARESRETSADPGPANNNQPPPHKEPTPQEAPLDPEFLAALPAEIRAEVIAEHKRKSLSTHLVQKPRKPLSLKHHAPLVQHAPQIVKVARPRKPTFTMQKLTEAKDVRAAMKEWCREFSDEGPYDEDVDALVGYLKKVVLEERDLGKAVGVVGWLGWVIGDMDIEGKWGEAVAKVRKGVGEAAQKRGLGSVNFG